MRSSSFDRALPHESDTLVDIAGPLRAYVRSLHVERSYGTLTGSSRCPATMLCAFPPDGQNTGHFVLHREWRNAARRMILVTDWYRVSLTPRGPGHGPSTHPV